MACSWKDFRCHFCDGFYADWNSSIFIWLSCCSTPSPHHRWQSASQPVFVWCWCTRMNRFRILFYFFGESACYRRAILHTERGCIRMNGHAILTTPSTFIGYWMRLNVLSCAVKMDFNYRFFECVLCVCPVAIFRVSRTMPLIKANAS